MNCNSALALDSQTSARTKKVARSIWLIGPSTGVEFQDFYGVKIPRDFAAIALKNFKNHASILSKNRIIVQKSDYWFFCYSSVRENRNKILIVSFVCCFLSYHGTEWSDEMVRASVRKFQMKTKIFTYKIPQHDIYYLNSV